MKNVFHIEVERLSRLTSCILVSPHQVLLIYDDIMIYDVLNILTLCQNNNKNLVVFAYIPNKYFKFLPNFVVLTKGTAALAPK